MTLSNYEHETIINWNSGEDMASFFTAEPRVWAKIERLRFLGGKSNAESYSEETGTMESHKEALLGMYW